MEAMHRVLVNVASSDWAVHFIAPDGQTRIGPWLLHDSHDEVLKILAWCGITEDELTEHHSAIRRWGCSSGVVMLTDAKLKALIERGRGWPWNGYELRVMKEAGKYPPTPIRPGLQSAKKSVVDQAKPKAHDTDRFAVIQTRVSQ